MTSVERVKLICKERKIPLSRLERDLEFANGYISQLKKGTFPDDRIYKISNYLGVSVEFIRTGKDSTVTKDEESKARNDAERRILMLCRKAGDATQEEREALIDQFESTIDMYLKFKGLSKEE